jgi:hypothetical protein
MAYVTKKQDPSDRLDYRWPWNEDEDGNVGQGWLVPGATLVDAVFTIYDDKGNEIDTEVDLTPLVVDDFSFTPTDATAWLMGGTLNKTYLVVCHVTDSAGRESDWTLKMRIVSK